MKGLHGTSWRCGEALSPTARPTVPALPGLFSTGLPLGLHERLQAAARLLGLSEREIATDAIERLLDEEGF